MRQSERRLFDALTPPDKGGVPHLPIVAGVRVTAVDKAVTPWVVTLLFPDGLSVPEVACVGWYNPTVNDIVLAARIDRGYVCLGGYAGAAKVVTTTTTTTGTTTPTAPDPDDEDPTPPTVRTKYVQPVSGRTWDAGAGAWRLDDDLRQGGESARRAFIFYGTRIADAKGAGTITGGTIYIRRYTSGGVYGKANLYLGTHGFETLPGSGASSLGNTQRWEFSLNQGRTLPLSAAQVAALNAGADGFGFEPEGLGYVSPDYFVGWPVSSNYPVGQLSLTVRS